MMLKFSTVAPATVRTGLTASADLKEWASQIKCNLDKPVQTSEPSFGERLKQAVAQRLGSASRIQASVAIAAEQETFGQRIKRAVQKHPKSKENAQKKSEQDRARYHPLKSRPPSKSG
jgi:hypothetical protein